jgi:transcriptional regulator with XRE-family HTH domain
MRLADHLDTLCWSQRDLARNAKVSAQSVSRALSGERVSRRIALAILQAVSVGYGRKMTIDDIVDLKIVTLKRRRKSTTQAEAVQPARVPRREAEK